MLETRVASFTPIHAISVLKHCFDPAPRIRLIMGDLAVLCAAVPPARRVRSRTSADFSMLVSYVLWISASSIVLSTLSMMFYVPFILRAARLKIVVSILRISGTPT